MCCYLIVIHLISLTFTEFMNEEEQTNKSKPPSKPYDKLPSLGQYRIVGFHAMECSNNVPNL